MKAVRLLLGLVLALSISSTAWAQFGLYGAPALLPLPATDAPPSPYGVTPAAATAPGVYPLPRDARRLSSDPAYPSRQSLAARGPTGIPASDALPRLDALPPDAQQPGCSSQMSQYSQGWPASITGDSPSCGTVGPGAARCCPWFGSVAALYMGRNKSDRLWTTYETNNNPNQLSTDAVTDWQVGGEVTFGRYFHCGRFGVAATYWSLDPLTGFSSRSVAGGSVSTPLMVDSIEFGGVNGTVLFDGAEEHRVWRRNEFQNIEINLIGGQQRYGETGYGPCSGCCGSNACGGCTPWSVGWLLGVRYFQFEEDLTFGSLDQGCVWGQNGGLDEAYLRDNVENSLFGFQVGADLGYQFASNWRLFATPKIGVYNNHVRHCFNLYRGDGTVANPTAASGVTGTYPVNSSEDVIAFLTEVNLGVDWQVTPRWSAFFGYRVLFATGIALADEQIPTYVVDIPEIADVNTNGQLVLHGAFGGVSFNF